MALRNILIRSFWSTGAIIVLLASSVKASPPSLTYQGRIVKSDGSPLVGPNISFIFQITDPSGACLIYQEQVTGYNMLNSNGVFDVPIGLGSVSWPSTGSFSVLDAFNNSASLTCGLCTGYSCSAGTGTYTPSIHDERRLKVQFHDGIAWKVISPDNVIRSVPFAGYAQSSQKLGAYSSTDFILKNDVNNSGSGTTSCNGGSFLTWNASTKTFGCAAAPSGSGATGSVTSITAGTGLTGGTITESGTIGLGAELTGLNSLSSLGFIKRTGIGTYSTATSVNLSSDVTGALSLANGGTGATTASAALNNLLPTQTGNSGKVLQTDGTLATWVTPSATGITSLTGDVTASGTGSVAATIAPSSVSNSKLAANAVDSSKINDGSIGFLDLNFAGTMTTNSGLLVSDGSQFYNKTCAGNQTLIWSVANGWICSAVTLSESDPKVGANTTNYLSKWDGSALVTSGVYESGGNVGIGTTSPLAPLHIANSFPQTDTSARETLELTTSDAAPFKLYSGIVGAATWTNRSAFLQTAQHGTGNGGNLLLQAYGGNVGIGTTSPGDKLEVAGKIRATHICAQNGTNCKDLTTAWTGGGGTVTDITAGAGLTGGTITGSGTIGLGTELSGVNSLASTGFVKRTGAGAYATASSIALGTDVSGNLPIANGGTGATTASAALDNLLPSQAGNSGKVLSTNGTTSSWIAAPVTGITALTGDVTASGTGSVAATIATGSVNSAKILDSSVGVVDLDFAGVMTTNTGLVVRNGTQFYNKTCAGNETLIWSVANGWICSAVTLTESDPKVGANTTNYLSKWNGSALIASGVYESGGNVGIGTTNPTDKLQVVGNMRLGSTTGSGSFPGTGSVLLFSDGPGGDNTDGLAIARHNVSSDISELRILIGDNHNSGPLADDSFVIGAGTLTAWNPLFTVNSSGNVGIGTSSPGAKLHLSGGENSWTDGIFLQQTGTSGRNYAISSRESGRFAISDETANMHRFVIDASGNIGIGTTSPATKLDVVGNAKVGSGSTARAGDYLSVTTASGTTKRAGIQFLQNSLSLFEIGTDVGNDNTNNFYIWDSVNSTDRLVVANTGNVGIGTTSPASKLQVSGAITNTVSTFSSAFTCGTSSLDFSNSNFLRLSPSAAIAAGACAVTLTNLVAGGSYTLVVTGNAATNAVTYAFSGYTFKYLPANAATTAGKDTIYTFLYDGTKVYVTWSGGY